MTESRWWYGVALFPLISLSYLLIAVLLISTESVPVVFGLVQLSFWGLFWTSALIVFVVPVFLYLDAKSLQTTDWAPNPLVYFTLGIIGVLLSPLILGVATRYLYLRYKHVGFG